MKKLMMLALTASAVIATAVPAEARQGCGAGYHRGPRGGCRPNRGPGVEVGRPQVGVFYPGHGYWNGGRYWQHRYRHHNGWRYR